MNIKSLLIGSAAALVAVSGARAADAIVAAEPEPVEYVRVCDAFGTGYFYIPGTETCLRIHGYFRYDVSGGELFESSSSTASGSQATYTKRARANFRITTASETEMGTLTTYAEVSFQRDTNGRTNASWLNNNPARVGIANGYTVDSETTLDHAWVQLGGVRLGYTDSLFERWNGFAGPVINDDNVFTTAAGGTNQINYTYNSGAFSAGISLEQGNASNTVNYVALPLPGGAATTTTHGWGIDDYMPHVVAGLGYNAGMINLRAVAGYDTRDLATQGGWGGKIRADLTVNDQISLMAQVVYGENTSAYTPWATGAANQNTWGAMVGGSYAATEKATFNFEGKWLENNVAGQSDAWGLVANVAYTVVPGLVVTPELVYRDMGTAADGAFGGFFRVQRSF